MTLPNHPSRLLRALSCSIAVTLSAAPALRAADTVAVPRSEFEQMKRDLAAMRQELNQLKTDRAMAPKLSPNAPRGSTAEAIALLNQRVDDLTSAAELSRPGETKMHLAGDASATFRLDDHDSRFTADFNPIFLWHLNKDLLFEAKVRFSLTEDETDTELLYAHLDWSLGDYVTLISGKYYNPINVFSERYSAGWINKLPSAPLGIPGLVPETNVGFQLRGVVPIASSTKLTLAAFVGNAPELRFDGFGTRVEFDNFDTDDGHKAYGGRVGLQIGPNFEVGYGIQQSRFEIQGDNVRVYDGRFGPLIDSYRDIDDISGWQQSVDLQASLDALKGRWTLLGQYVWTDLDSFALTEIYREEEAFPAFFDPFTGFFLPALVFPERRFSTTIDDRREGGYVQLSYRGQNFTAGFLNQLEVVVRGDRVDLDFDSEVKRLTFGLDYWMTSSTVLKAAYELSQIDTPFGDEDFGTFIFGISTGL